MKIIWSKEIDRILNIGKSLSDEGIDNWALTKKEALGILEELLILKVPILGGDVYEMINGYIQPNGDGWFYNVDVEDINEYHIKKSIEKASIFINKYNYNSNIFFGIVPSNRLNGNGTD